MIAYSKLEKQDNMLYEKSDDIVRGLYKSASYVIQAIVFRDTGKYIKHQKDLLEAVNKEEKELRELGLVDDSSDDDDLY